MKVCDECKRPWVETRPEQRARRGDHPGVEHQAAAELGDPAEACKRVLIALRGACHFEAGNPGGWVSAKTLRIVAGGGDGPRRARQLRDEYRWPIEVEMRTNPRQARYRLTDDKQIEPVQHVPELFPEETS